MLRRLTKMITAGIDCGAKNTKTIILKDGEIIGRGKVLTGSDQVKAAEQSLGMAAKAADISRKDIQKIFSTGSGRTAVKMADDTIAFIEAMARALEVTVEEMGLLCLQSDKEIPMNAQCVVFAESEVVGLIHARTPKSDISKAIYDSIAGRIVSIIRRIGANKDIV